MITDRMRASFAGLERQKADILVRVRDWPADRLAYRSAAREWSAAEIIDHVVKVEHAILGAVRRGVQEPQEPHPVGVADRLRSLLIYLLFRTPYRVRVPRSAPEVLPAQDVDLDDAIAHWNATRIDLLALLSEVGAGAMRTGSSGIP